MVPSGTPSGPVQPVRGAAQRRLIRYPMKTSMPNATTEKPISRIPTPGSSAALESTNRK